MSLRTWQLLAQLDRIHDLQAKRAVQFDCSVSVPAPSDAASDVESAPAGAAELAVAAG
jgi:hypothetical protein